MSVVVLVLNESTRLDPVLVALFHQLEVAKRLQDVDMVFSRDHFQDCKPSLTLISGKESILSCKLAYIYLSDQSFHNAQLSALIIYLSCR